jgi:predicted RNase H-like HicB family nuclease
MDTKRFVYYEEEGMWVGWMEEYPDYRTQGKTLDELRENLRDIYDELTSGRIPCVRRVGELVVA